MRRRGIALVSLLFVGSGCVGAITRDEFRDELARRTLVGGETGDDIESGADIDGAPAGLAGSFPERGVAQVLEHLGSDDVEVSMMTFDLATLFGTLEGRDPARPDEVDLYVFVDAQLASIEPVQLDAGARDRFDEMSFPVSSVRFDELDAQLEEARAIFGDPDGEITTLTWMAFVPGRPELIVRVATDRRAETIRFDLDGQVVEGF